MKSIPNTPFLVNKFQKPSLLKALADFLKKDHQQKFSSNKIELQTKVFQDTLRNDSSDKILLK